MMKVLLVYPSKLSATGNVSTILRIQKYLALEGIECVVKDANAISSKTSQCPQHQLRTLVDKENVTGILFLHALKSAKIVLCECAEERCETNCPVPYGVIFGGTDLNVDVSDPEKLTTMQKVLRDASFAVAFTDALKKKGLEICPNLKVHVQPQGMEIPEFRWSQKDPNDNFLQNCNSTRKLYTFLMVTGIRPVKDPLYLLHSWTGLCQKYKDLNLKLIILGPVLDEEYATTFFQYLKSLRECHFCMDISDPRPKGLCDLFSRMNESVFPILYSPPLSPDNLQRLLCSNQIFASVNSSLSEGMASSILESMAHKIPVIARDNDGNKAVIRDGETGLLYRTPDEFAKKVIKLVKDPGMWKSIAEKAYDSILKHHSPTEEKRFYRSICENYFDMRNNGSCDL